MITGLCCVGLSGINHDSHKRKYKVMNYHVVTFIEASIQMEAECIVLENVLRLLSKKYIWLVIKAVGKLRQAGYYVSISKLNFMYWKVSPRTQGGTWGWCAANHAPRSHRSHRRDRVFGWSPQHRNSTVHLFLNANAG